MEIIIAVAVVLMISISIFVMDLVMSNNEESQPQNEASVSPATKQPEKLTQTTETPKYTEFPQYEYKFVDLNLKQIINVNR